MVARTCNDARIDSNKGTTDMPVMKEYESAANNCVAYAEEGDLLDVLAPNKIRVSATGVWLFNKSWPCSELRDSRSYWFEFDDNGDLIDCDVPQHDDGAAAVALAQDAKQWLFNDEWPAWAKR